MIEMIIEGVDEKILLVIIKTFEMQSVDQTFISIHILNASRQKVCLNFIFLSHSKLHEKSCCLLKLLNYARFSISLYP